MDIYGDIEELKTTQKIHYLVYRKTGLYVLYSFIFFIFIIIAMLFIFQRDIVMDVTATVSSDEIGVVIPAQVGGQIEEIFVAPLQLVSYGEKLMQLDATEIRREKERQKAEINDLNKQLLYLDYFETSVLTQVNMMPSDAFGISARVDNHIRNLSDDDRFLNLSSLEFEGSRQQINHRINQLNGLIADYERFYDIVNERSTGEINDAVVQSRADDFILTLSTFDYYVREDYMEYDYEKQYFYIPNPENPEEEIRIYEEVRIEIPGYRYIVDEGIYSAREGFISTTRIGIRQNISAFRDEIRLLESELSSLDRGIEMERGTVNRQTNNASEALLFEIFDGRDVLEDRLSLYERELARLEESYENTVITARADGYFQIAEGLNIGSHVAPHTSVGRMFDPQNQENIITGFIHSADFNRIAIDQPVRFLMVDGNNTRHFAHGTINFISQIPTFTERGNYFMFQASMESNIEELDFVYGMSGELNIVTGRTTVMRYLIDMLFN